MNQTFHNDYNKFMLTLLENGFEEEVPEGELFRDYRKVGMYHPKKPTQIRIIFECSAKYRGISLNDVLLQGSDDLVDVLRPFRREPVGMMGDIEKMFHQVMVIQNNRDCMELYCWPVGDLEYQLKIYTMAVHIFGAVSSLSCTNYALQETIKDDKQLFSNRITQSALSRLYVDDWLNLVPTHEEVVQLVREISTLCQTHQMGVKQ